MKLVSVKTSDTKMWATVVSELIAGVCLSISFWLTILSILGVSVNAVLIACAVLIPFLLYAIASIPSVGRYLPFYAIMLTALFALVRISDFLNGFVVFFNKIADAINNINGLVVVPLSKDIPAGKEKFYLQVACILLMFLLSVLIVSSIKKKKSLACVLVTIIPLIFAFFFKLMPNIIFLSAFIVSITLFLLITSIKNKDSALKLSGLTLEIILALIAFLLLFLSIFSSYSSSKVADRVRNFADSKIEGMRYSSGIIIDGMPNGNIDGADTLNYTGQIVFNIKVENPATLYLRKYVGENFISGRWETLPKSAYSGEYLGLNEWMEVKGYYPFTLLSYIHDMDAQRTGSGVRKGEITIENVAENSNVIFTPYEVVPDANLLSNRITDKGIFANGAKGDRKYTITTYTPKYDDYSQHDLVLFSSRLGETAKGYFDFINAESVYRNFVHANYLSVDKEYEELVSSTGIKTELGTSEINYQTITNYIRKYFKEEYAYSSEITNPKKGADALKYFVTESRSGYDCHFATLATLMFRSAGIPARYVEGYYLSAEDLRMYATVSDAVLEVYDTSSHAWVEIYVDSFGWIPVEVTPGYFILDNIKNEDVIDSLEKVSVKDDAEYFDEEEAAVIDDEEDGRENGMKALSIVGIALAVMALAFTVAVLVRRRLTMKKIRRASTKEDIILGYRIVSKTIRKKKMNESSLGAGYAEYKALVYKEVYSKDGLSADERRRASNFVLRFVKQKAADAKKDNSGNNDNCDD